MVGIYLRSRIASERISNAIGKVTDAITDALADVNPGDALFEELRPLIKGP